MSQRRLLVDNLEQDKIKIIRINNPFDLDNSDVIEATYKEISSVIDYLPESDTKTIVSLNGKVLTDEECKSLIPSRNDCIVVKPVVAGGGGGSNILGILAMVALNVVAFTVAPMIGGWIGGGTGLTAAGAFTTASMIAFGAIMSIGGLLLGSLFQEDIPSYDNGSSSTTYGWGGVKALTGQGHPVAVTFGTVKTAGQVLSAHVTNTDDKQYLNILLSGGEGELDSITDIRIDGNPIANYDGVTYDVRLGTNNQTIIPNFNDTYADKNLSFILEVGNPATQQTDGDGGEGLKVGIDFPQGLYYVNNDGSASATSIHLSIDYRIRTSAPGVTPEVYGAWQSWISETITESKNSAVRKTYRKDNIPIGKYEVRVTKDSESGSTNRYVNTCQWSLLSHIIYDDFTYPRIALIGIKALATDQLSGSMPEITWKQSRANVLVWNPNTLAYENKPATNPAWAAYDVVHYCRKIYNINTSQYEYVVFGFPYSRIDYSAFKAWADFCDQPIESPSDLSALLTFNHLVDTMTSFWEALKPIENIGRGKVVLKGTKVSCIYDGVKSPTQQFTMGNIIKDSFNEEFLPMRDRANAIEITFFDETQNYERNTVYVYDSTFDTTSAVPNTSQITLYGCTRLKQAVKEGRYRLNLNKYLIRTITFDADIDSIACQIGDVINFQHDVPQWGWGGRIVSASSNLVVLDQEVELEAGIGYQIQVTLPDGTTVIKNVASVAEDSTTNILSITSAFTTIPAEYASYAFGKYNISTKPFRVIGITRSADFRRRITALEYIADVYAGQEEIDVIEYSDLNPVISNVNLTQYINAYGQTFLHISWNPSNYSYGGVIIAINGIKVAQVGKEFTSHDYLITDNGQYVVKIFLLDYFGVIRDVAEASILIGTMPSAPSQISLTISDQVYCRWGAVNSRDIDFYELRTNANAGEDDGLLFKGFALSCNPILTNRSGIVYLYSHSSSGTYSNPLEYVYNFPAPSAPTVVITNLFQGFSISTTTFPSNLRGIHVKIDDGISEKIYTSFDNAYNFKTSGGIFDVSAAFFDVFGDGAYSSEQTKIVSPTIDPALIAAESLSLEKMDAIINSAVVQAQNSVSQATFSSTVNTLQIADGTNASNITQTAGQVTSIVTELGKPIDQCSYTAIAQANTAINLRASKANLISQINICPEAITIDGKYVHITGDTVVDNNVIVGKMLAANTITANKIAIGTIPLTSMTTDAQSTINTAYSNANTAKGFTDVWKYPNTTYINGGSIYTGSITANQISAGAITADKISANSIDATKISQNSIPLNRLLQEAWTPCWTAYILEWNSAYAGFTHPSQFPRNFPSAIPSRGFLQMDFGSDGFSIGSQLYTMNVSCPNPVVKYQAIRVMDDYYYIYLNGNLIASGGSGEVNSLITYNFISGVNTIEFVSRNTRGRASVMLIGDIIDNVSVKFYS